MDFERKINRIGGTHYFSLPVDWLKTYNVHVDDVVIISVGPKGELIVRLKKK